MGLDMWLRAKTKAKAKGQPTTGVCGGLFPLGPTSRDGSIEIGYWRKAYDQQEVIRDAILANPPASGSDKSETGGAIVTKEAIDDILDVADVFLRTHEFDEDGEAGETFLRTYDSERKWHDTIKFFTVAKQIYDEDPDAVVYYCEWQ